MDAVRFCISVFHKVEVVLSHIDSEANIRTQRSSSKQSIQNEKQCAAFLL